MKRVIYDYFIVIIASMALAVSVNVFLLPAKISSGGVGTIGTVLYYFLSVPLSVTNIVLNALIFALGFKFLGRTSVLRSVFGVVAFTISLEITKIIPTYSGDILIAIASGGILMGIALGLVIRAGASTGGSDFLGVIINNISPHLTVSKIIFVLDAIVILLSGVAFRSFEVAIYSLITLYVASVINNAVLSFGNLTKNILVISDNATEISKAIMGIFERGTTGIYCKGMYSNRDKLMIMCVASPREVPKIISCIQKADEKAFVIISDATEVIGEGFKKIRISYRKSG